ncbi:MAG: pentapeptide repeat-containing protein, partial [Pseudomonadota bacterium]
MANPDHVAKLFEGVEAWNQWREENPDIRPDLSRDEETPSLRQLFIDSGVIRDHERVPLSGVDLEDADLREADLRETDLRETDLREADLRGALLRDAELRGAYLRGANLRGADVSGANVKTINSGLAEHDARDPEFTDLSRVLGLTQSQLGKMVGDTGTIISPYHSRPTHWPEFEPAVGDVAESDGRSEVFPDKEIIHTGPFGT